MKQEGDVLIEFPTWACSYRSLSFTSKHCLMKVYLYMFIDLTLKCGWPHIRIPAESLLPFSRWGNWGAKRIMDFSSGWKDPELIIYIVSSSCCLFLSLECHGYHLRYPTQFRQSWQLPYYSHVPANDIGLLKSLIFQAMLRTVSSLYSWEWRLFSVCHLFPWEERQAQ